MTNEIQTPQQPALDNTAESALLVCITDEARIPCDTFADCQRVINEFVEALGSCGLGSTAFYNLPNIGVILHPTKGAFAHVSYNGRVWQGAEYVAGQKEITDLQSSDF
jgi:hypothetical protein